MSAESARWPSTAAPTCHPRDRLVDALRHAAQLPWFVRNLAIKVLITVRLGRLTRLLGHKGGWPY